MLILVNFYGEKDFSTAPTTRVACSGSEQNVEGSRKETQKRKITEAVPVIEDVDEPPKKKTAATCQSVEDTVMKDTVLDGPLVQKECSEVTEREKLRLTKTVTERTQTQSNVITVERTTTFMEKETAVQAPQMVVAEPQTADEAVAMQNTSIDGAVHLSSDHVLEHEVARNTHIDTTLETDSNDEVATDKDEEERSLSEILSEGPEIPSSIGLNDEQNGLELTCTVTNTIDVECEEIHDMIPLDDTSVIVASTRAIDIFTEGVLTKYSLKDGEKLSTIHGKSPWGMAVVKVGQTSYLALSDLDKMSIELYDTTDLKKCGTNSETTIDLADLVEDSPPYPLPVEFENTHTGLSRKSQIYSVAPAWPSRLWSPSPATLWYVDDSKSPRVVKALSCCTLPPKPGPPASGMSTQRKDIWDIITMQYGEEQLTVTAEGVTHGLMEDEYWEYEGRDGVTRRHYTYRSKLTMVKKNSEVCAYSPETGLLKWRATGKLSGMGKEICAEAIATDGSGHLFVCDSNNSCAHMFSKEGRYLGPLLKEGQQGLGKPKSIRWFNNSLIVAHKKKGEKYCVSQLNLKYYLG